MGPILPRSPWSARPLALLAALMAFSAAPAAPAATSRADERVPSSEADGSGRPPDGKRQPTRAEIEAFLDSRSLPQSSQAGASLEVPPPPPRHRGMVLEAGTGVAFPLGALRHVSPPSPWFQLHLGYEPAKWFMVLINGDFTLANTSYAARPPAPRTYAHYAFGAGARFQFSLAEWLGVHAQLELGASEVTEEVLVQYGYTQADELHFHYGARLGVEWLQINPHLALGLQGTFRNYPGLDRINDASAPTALMTALALRYAF